MSRKVYFDVNIVVDILDTKRVNNKNVNLLLKRLLYENINIVISEDMLSTIFYIDKDNDKVLSFFKTIQKFWTISPFGKDVIKDAIGIAQEKKLDLEDVLQSLCAKANGCEAIITNDNKFYDCGVNIFTAEEFLNEMKI